MDQHDRDLALRISQGLDTLDQANAIFNFVLFSLQSFISTGDRAWDHRLAASVNVSRLVDHYFDMDSDTIVAASREVALHRLPQLLCISLVSAMESCLKDMAELLVRTRDSAVSEQEMSKNPAKLMLGGPADYLARLADEFGIPSLIDGSWDDFHELVATRNVIVHSAKPVADDRYVRNAGNRARSKSGESLEVNNSYLVGQYVVAKGLLYSLLLHFQRREGGEQAGNPVPLP